MRDTRAKPSCNRAVQAKVHGVHAMTRWVEFDWGPAETHDSGDASAAAANAFSASMPARYRVLFDLRTARKHAGICLRRGERPAYAEVWRTLADGSAALCVVADDRPGLLSAIAAALIFHRLDVITALVFSRGTAGGNREAVDLVWVRRTNSEDTAAIDEDEATSVGQVLGAILSGSISVEEIAAQTPSGVSQASEQTPQTQQTQQVAHAKPTRQTRPTSETVVRFDEEDEEGLSPLIVEAPDRPGVLLKITREIFQQGAQIVRSLVRSAGGRAFNHFELAEFNGGRLTSERREQIRSAVLAALSLHEAHRPTQR
jgi:[protein-PII] uridylyltransferase